ncbi:MAG TPA: Gfo/Idh/MocA family oxidoreductase [Pirellulaceae bacterium]|nr:Gfo/Idh/MocA family oxidoreductase [Pirellulaceae bacterium]HMO91852.1 Gfo/Idh/MocA family oxidoreductase [Pirellulaceae bacterium]HMP69738.1 Gfo/Idh/MocA family oxidoreductase [Pirellulaceae bacterium]
MSDRICRWGFLSTAEIGFKNWQAVHKSGNGVVAGVASRSRDSAQKFIDRAQSYFAFDKAPEAHGSYESIIESNSIDAVYIPLPTGLRKTWVIRAAEAGKHVLCEKPCAVSADDLAEMIDACRQNNVQFMDGVMYMHSSRLTKLREVLDDGKSVGKIKRIACQFSFNAPDEFHRSNIRTDSRLEPHGCLGDLGWYTIRFALWVMRGRMPQKVCARALSVLQRPDSPAPVPMDFSAELVFDEETSASFFVSFQTHHQQWANISGTRGHLTVNDFVLPYFGNQLGFAVQNAEFIVDGCDFWMERHDTQHNVAEYANSHASAQETNLFRRMSEIVLSGKLDPYYPEISLKTQAVLDACFESALSNSSIVQPKPFELLQAQV